MARPQKVRAMNRRALGGCQKSKGRRHLYAHFGRGRSHLLSHRCRFCYDFTYLKISYSISKQPKRSFIVSLLPCYFLLLSKYISTLWNVLFAFSSGFLIFLYLAWPFPKPVLGGVCLKAFCRNATSNCSGHHAVWAITRNFIFTSHLQHINC